MMIDGVNKFFIVHHERGSMHFDGCPTLVDVAERAIMKMVSLLKREDFDKVIAETRHRIDKIVEARNEDDRKDAEITARKNIRVETYDDHKVEWDGDGE